ncbi:hypothetical protein L596_024014 [Steinernema carpocapsae]|uniref:Uncharacterized protein n=1 Tax=Steinernema carpocapsae TaxID=34508 RepID=A0A4U5MFG3_STECR|nr:hypothetical protein L596_024014 [Steinernema carpocapsae]
MVTPDPLSSSSKISSPFADHAHIIYPILCTLAIISFCVLLTSLFFKLAGIFYADVLREERERREVQRIRDVEAEVHEEQPEQPPIAQIADLQESEIDFDSNDPGHRAEPSTGEFTRRELAQFRAEDAREDVDREAEDHRRSPQQKNTNIAPPQVVDETF